MLVNFIDVIYLQYFISHYNKEYELNFPDDLLIYDTTLRDGEQTPVSVSAWMRN